MSHANRGRIIVDTDGNWRLYTNSIPAGSTMLGTVTQDDQTGALCKTTIGVYVMINASAVSSLDQRKVKAALGISNNAGRPVEIIGGRRRSLYLDDATFNAALKIGHGSASEGVRLACSAFQTDHAST